jgi:hypothetical protein
MIFKEIDNMKYVGAICHYYGCGSVPIIIGDFRGGSEWEIYLIGPEHFQNSDFK